MTAEDLINDACEGVWLTGLTAATLTVPMLLKATWSVM